MKTNLSELRYKEVISLEDGCRCGYVGDLELDLDEGRIRALVIPGRRRFFGLFGREPDRTIPWSAVHCFGEDTILIRGVPETPRLEAGTSED